MRTLPDAALAAPTCRSGPAAAADGSAWRARSTEDFFALASPASEPAIGAAAAIGSAASARGAL